MFNISKKSGRVTAVIVAGGSSVRFGSDKLTEKICGKPVLIRSLEAFDKCSDVSDIVLVARKDKLEYYRALIFEYGIKKDVITVPGGESRLESVMAGLDALPARTEYVAIHDAARPLVTPETISRVCLAAKRYKAAVPCSVITGTVKQKQNDKYQTIDRDSLLVAETPQVFQKDIIKAALHKVRDKGAAITDDSMAVELLGIQPSYIINKTCNLKITEKQDIVIANAIWREYRDEDR